MALHYNTSLEQLSAKRGYYGLASWRLAVLRRLARIWEIHVELTEDRLWRFYGSSEAVLELLREFGKGCVDPCYTGESTAHAPWSVEFDWWSE